MRFGVVTCSYLLFSLLIFNLFAILSTEFSPVFSQLFTLLTQSGRVYDIFSLSIIVVCLVVIVVNIYHICKSALLNTLLSIIFVVFSVALFAILLALGYWFICRILEHSQHISQDMLPNDSAGIIAFVISCVSWFFLAFLPLSYRILSIKLNLENKLAQLFLIYQPQMTTILIIMCASAFYPYFYDLLDNRINIAFFIIQAVLLILLIIKNDRNMISYDYVNIHLFCFIVLCSILCSASIFKSEFINAQLTLYMLGILAWCFEWSYNVNILKNQLQTL